METPLKAEERIELAEILQKHGAGTRFAQRLGIMPEFAYVTAMNAGARAREHVEDRVSLAERSLLQRIEALEDLRANQ